MKGITTLIKPSSSLCNMRCSYCFYHDVTENRVVREYGLMGPDVLEAIVSKALDESESFCRFAFQGGEPTLSGLGFYEGLIGLVAKHNRKGLEVSYSIQTNGLAIDGDWARFLSENKFLVGLSLDGHKDIHDSNRLDALGGETFTRVMKAADALTAAKAEFNILCVVTSQTARHISKIYSFFKKAGFGYLQFIQHINPFEYGMEYVHGLSADRYRRFLITLFDEWYDDFMSGNYVSIRHIDNVVRQFMGYPPEQCGMNGRCSCQFVFEADGGCYPCDFYVVDRWRLGNILENGYAEMMGSEKAQEFVGRSRAGADSACPTCEWAGICGGGCMRYRDDGGESAVLSDYCGAYKDYFGHVRSKVGEVIRRLRGRSV
ncbi:MAG: anaerobic sulfatase maturase [Oscillospiraceae bacterium]|nr:anaerobic sulfatase maturase [Oscillospiraceae bacterium]